MVRCVYQHKTKATPGFTSRYAVDRLVAMTRSRQISREKDIKKWRRAWKVRLIEEENPDRPDLYSDICR
ncbi:MAG: GIY-YIG nuclease family protein [Hyphomicrobiales bacterium]